MGTEAIKFVPSTTKEGLKTFTCTETDSKGKTSVFTAIDRDKDGKITNNDGFTFKGSISKTRAKQYLESLEYKEIPKTQLKDEKGDIIVLDNYEGRIDDDKEYNIGTFANSLSLKSNVASQDANAATNTQPSYNPGPGYTVDNNILNNSLSMSSGMLSNMIMQAYNTPGSLFQWQMPNFVASLWNSIGAALKANPYTPPPVTNSDGSTGTASSGSSISSSADNAAAADDTVVESSKTIAERQAAQDAQDKADDDKIKQQQEEEKAKADKAKKDAETKAKEVSAICRELYTAMKGITTDAPTLRDNILNKIKKENVIEVLYEWDQKYAKSMDNESLVESIDNDIYGAQEYTNSLKDKLTARCSEIEGLTPDAEHFNAVVTAENKSWYTSDSNVETAFKDMLASAMDKLPELKKAYENKKPKETKTE